MKGLKDSGVGIMRSALRGLGVLRSTLRLQGLIFLRLLDPKTILHKAFGLF